MRDIDATQEFVATDGRTSRSTIGYSCESSVVFVLSSCSLPPFVFLYFVSVFSVSRFHIFSNFVLVVPHLITFAGTFLSFEDAFIEN